MSRRSRASGRVASTSTATASPMCRCRAGISARFDRRKCKGPLNGPQARGRQDVPGGLDAHSVPGPQFKNVAENGSAEASYYTWVDQLNTFGLGDNIPIATGNANKSLMALKDGKWINMRVPYPLGFFAKWIDGRIDDPNGGWKGRALWSTDGNRTPFHRETGKGTLPKIVKFQMRPDPLAHSDAAVLHGRPVCLTGNAALKSKAPAAQAAGAYFSGREGTNLRKEKPPLLLGQVFPSTPPGTPIASLRIAIVVPA